MRSGKSRRSFLHKFYFIMPRENADANELAKRLIGLEPVEEVLLTEGAFGFIVKAKYVDGKEPSDVTDYITRNIGGRYGKVVSYYEYRK